MSRLIRFACLVMLALSFAHRAGAHALSLAQADAQFASNGEFTVQIDFDVVAMMADVPPTALRDSEVMSLAAVPPARFKELIGIVRERLQKEFKVLAQDGTEITAGEIALPSEAEVLRVIRESLEQKTQPSNFIGQLRGSLPPTTKEVRLQFPAVMGAVAVKVSAAGREPFDTLQLPGETGPPCELGEIRAETPKPPMTRGQVLARYLFLGFTHILPKGTDHILFVLGLFLLSTRFKPLLWQVTAFTLAHSITLALAMYGVLALPPKLVESLIALSISFVAIENVFSSKLHAWRPMVVFVFGLVHGLGFASVLLELGLPRNEFGAALVAFNVGVEGGQLAVIGGATAVLFWFFKKPWYRAFVTIPASCLIAVIGLIWAYDRIIG